MYEALTYDVNYDDDAGIKRFHNWQLMFLSSFSISF